MSVEYCVVAVLVLAWGVGAEDRPWDLAVAVRNQIKLLSSNGSQVGTVTEEFGKLKALAFDTVRHQFVVSDGVQQYDTIYTVKLTKETAISAVVSNLPDDVQGIALNPITNILYWTDSLNQTINYVSLNDTNYASNVFLAFEHEKPHDIAVDSCSGYIYWTNSDIMGPTVERARINGTDREVLVKDELFMPSGIAIDHLEQRIYWADRSEGIYFKIFSADLTGNNRQLVYQGTHQEPFGVAVDSEHVYWTEVDNNSLWRKKKRDLEAIPEMLHRFGEKPRGLVVKNADVKDAADCANLRDAIKDFAGPTKEYFEETTSEVEVTECLNGGVQTPDGCKCHRGYAGQNCEISICYNFCIHGVCRLSSLGYTECVCAPGFVGSRCERNVCDGYCLNDGNCVNQGILGGPACECQSGFRGDRCEISNDPSELCSLFCENRENDMLIDKIKSFVCRCEGDSVEVLGVNNVTKSELLAEAQDGSLLDFLRNPIFICMSVSILVLIAAIIILLSMVFKSRQRPRIKKRIIVNKNVTPLTYRQPPQEQCEITIENCCNMNVCETPCFDPPTLRKFKKDEKKTLLANMENGDDLY